MLRRLNTWFTNDFFLLFVLLFCCSVADKKHKRLLLCQNDKHSNLDREQNDLQAMAKNVFHLLRLIWTNGLEELQIDKILRFFFYFFVLCHIISIYDKMLLLFKWTSTFWHIWALASLFDFFRRKKQKYLLNDSICYLIDIITIAAFIDGGLFLTLH